MAAKRPYVEPYFMIMSFWQGRLALKIFTRMKQSGPKNVDLVFSIWL
jgi:hypothetical protein